MKKFLFIVLFALISFVSFAQTYNDTYKIDAPTVAVTQDLTVGDDATITGDAGITGNLTVTGYLDLSSLVMGTNVFTTTAETDTVLIAGAVNTDVYIVCGQFTSAIDQQDILQWEAIAGGLVVHRMAAGESALKYSYIRLK